jgi:hypothetical protein
VLGGGGAVAPTNRDGVATSIISHPLCVVIIFTNSSCRGVSVAGSHHTPTPPMGDETKTLAPPGVTPVRVATNRSLGRCASVDITYFVC